MDNYTKDYNANSQYGYDSVDVTVASAYKNMFAWMAGALGLSALTSYYVMNRIMQRYS